jgi:putative effector of murein hydrolase LrgA (UPF0299 family)
MNVWVTGGPVIDVVMVVPGWVTVWVVPGRVTVNGCVLVTVVVPAQPARTAMVANAAHKVNSGMRLFMSPPVVIISIMKVRRLHRHKIQVIFYYIFITFLKILDFGGYRSF